MTLLEAAQDALALLVNGEIGSELLKEVVIQQLRETIASMEGG